MLGPSIGGYGTPKFHGENFHGWLYIGKIRECFLPQKFSAIWWYFPYDSCNFLVRYYNNQKCSAWDLLPVQGKN